MKTRKGVYFSFDAIIASVIFILTIISLLSYWYSVRETVMSDDPLISDEALRISNLIYLVSDNFGFAVSYDDKSLDYQKIKLYEASRTSGDPASDLEKMKQDISCPYNFQVKFEIYRASNTGLESTETISLGEEAPDTSKTVSKVTRSASILDETGKTRIAVITVTLYQ